MSDCTSPLKSYLFVPGDNGRKLEKSLESAADAVIFDLEDAVGPDRKIAARRMVTEVLRRPSRPMTFVRVNDLSTGVTEEDVRAVAAFEPAGYVLPKCEGPEDIDRLSKMIEAHSRQRAARIVAIATETVKAVRSLARRNWSHPSLFGITWGGEDLAADIGASRNRDGSGNYSSVFVHARDNALLAAREAGVEAIDAAFVDFRDAPGLEREAREAFESGFDGKLAIHPAQIETIHAAMTPTGEQIDWAEKVLAALTEAGAGVAQLDGKMLDRPHERSARRILKHQQDELR